MIKNYKRIKYTYIKQKSDKGALVPKIESKGPTRAHKYPNQHIKPNEGTNVSK